VALAVKQMHSHNADTIIVLRGGSNTPVGIVTDSDIIDKVVMKGEDSEEVFLKLINILLFSAGTLVMQTLINIGVLNLLHLGAFFRTAKHQLSA
jgi:hypothetical protein